MEFIDTHTHNYDEAYCGCEDEVIERAVNAGVCILLQADTGSSTRERMFSLCKKHRGVLYPMIGLYPGSVDAGWKDEIDLIIKSKQDNKDIIAVGEIGLDYHFSTEFKDEQKEALRCQLDLALKWNLPVNIHLRDATGDFLDIIKDYKGSGLRGNVHAFSGSVETIQTLNRYGDWYVGIGGVLTFKKASIAEEIRKIPLEKILLETDAPYLAPTPHRGERNENSFIPVIASFLAERKGVSIEEVARITTDNAKKLFSL